MFLGNKKKYNLIDRENEDQFLPMFVGVKKTINATENKNNNNDPTNEIENKNNDTKEYPILKNDLKTWNISLGIVHGLSFIAILVLTIIYNSKIPSYGISTDFYVYDSINNIFATNFQIISLYNPSWVLLPFPLITSFFHIMLGTFLYERYSFEVLYKGIQYYRWIEYSITAGLMTWVIWVLSGGTNIFLGLSLLFLNINMNFFGLVNEVLNSTNKKEEKIYLIIGLGDKNISKNDGRSNNKELNEDINENITLKQWYEQIYFKEFDEKVVVTWWPLLIAFLNFFIIWAILLTYFFEAVASRSSSVPWFVWTIDIGLFSMFLMFGLVMVLHYSSKQAVIEEIKKSNGTLFKNYKSKNYFTTIFASRYYNELFYQILSLTSKLFLTWFLWGGFIGNLK